MAHAAAQHLARVADENRRLAPGNQKHQDEVLAEVLEVVTRAGEEAVQRTPEQLDVLAEAGVVDAGAHGLVLILAGIVAGLRGEESTVEIPEQAPARISAPQHSDSRYRYCVNFIVLGEDLRGDEFEPALREIGDSVLVVGDNRTLRVHVHTDEPEGARRVFEGHGTVSQVDAADMRAQIADRAARRAGEATRPGVVAVVSGDGLRSLYEELGAHVIDGGTTMNPSTDEILAGIHSVGAEGVLVLPNSSNVILAARHAAELSDRDAHVVECTSQQAGLAALVELDRDAAVAENLTRFEGLLGEIAVGAVAPAARDDAQGRFVRGDAVGFVDGEIRAWGGAGTTLVATMTSLVNGRAELLTIVEGTGAPIHLDEVATLAPDDVEVEVHRGGQPSYWWLLAAQ
jgi:dihydroxyacetone kinase-like predicted kinase